MIGFFLNPQQFAEVIITLYRKNYQQGSKDAEDVDTTYQIRYGLHLLFGLHSRQALEAFQVDYRVIGLPFLARNLGTGGWSPSRVSNRCHFRRFFLLNHLRLDIG
jgi:hypothetical protein